MTICNCFLYQIRKNYHIKRNGKTEINWQDQINKNKYQKKKKRIN